MKTVLFKWLGGSRSLVPPFQTDKLNDPLRFEFSEYIVGIPNQLIILARISILMLKQTFLVFRNFW